MPWSSGTKCAKISALSDTGNDEIPKPRLEMINTTEPLMSKALQALMTNHMYRERNGRSEQNV